MIRTLVPVAAAGAVALTAVAGWARSARRLRARTDELELAEHDGLTGLWRREGFERRASVALACGNTACLLDLDGFKQINDTYGHPVGDEVLRAVANRLITELGPAALIARFGGDEFALIAKLDLPTVNAHAQLDHLVATLMRPIATDAGELEVGVSLGAVWLRDLPGHDTALGSGPGRFSRLLTEALSHADIAMYEAKTQCRGWRLYDRHSNPIRPASRVCSAPARRYREHGRAALALPATGTHGRS